MDSFKRLIVGFLIALFSLTAAKAIASDRPIVGRVSALTGEVYVDRKKVKMGAAIRIGSVILTKNGKCTLLLGRESVVHLDRNSKMKITQYLVDTGKTEKALLDLKFGRTRALIKSKSKRRKNFHLRSRNAVMGVRGTQVYIDNPQDLGKQPTFLTLEGEADLYFMRPGEKIGEFLKQIDRPAPPDSGSAPPSKVVLKANEMFKGSEAPKSGGTGTGGGDGGESGPGGPPSGGGVVQMNSEQAQNFAAGVGEVAEFMTPGQMQDFVENHGHPPPGWHPPPEWHPPPPPDYDPVADGLASVLLNIQIVRQ